MEILKNDFSSGYLEIITGPMYSGKTSKILELYKQFTFCDINTFVINYAEDTRYSSTHLSTHDNKMIPCTLVTMLSSIINLDGDDNIGNKDLMEKFHLSKVILINEGQFFKDIVKWVTLAVEKYNKSVYVCGLDCDYERKKFGDWLDLQLICDKYYKLHSYCSCCKKKPAIFSYRLSNEVEQKVIGSINYIPLCRFCYNLKKNLNK
jgi:thymidine kinase